MSGPSMEEYMVLRQLVQSLWANMLRHTDDPRGQLSRVARETISDLESGFAQVDNEATAIILQNCIHHTDRFWIGVEQLLERSIAQSQP